MPSDIDPIYADTLDAIALEVADVLPDWSDVVTRANRHRARKILSIGAVAAVILVATAVVAGPAFGLRLGSIINFWSSAGAPAHVRHDFSGFDLGAPPGLAPGAIASQTRRITVTQFGGGSHTLYVSPTKSGGFCFTWTDAVGGCDQLGTVPLNISWGPHQVLGTVASAYVSTVKIAFDDGTLTEPQITWVSGPINAGFFAYAIPAGKTVAQIDGYNATGTLVAREGSSQPSRRTSPPEFALTGQESVALTVSTPEGTATAYTAPSLTAGKCAWFELDGRDERLYGDNGCMPHGYTPEGAAFRFVHIGNSILFAGAASPRYARLTLQFADGPPRTVTPTSEGLILYSLPGSLSSGTQPVTVTAYQANGQVIFTYPTTDATQ